MSSLLLELLCEEIPASMQRNAIENLEKLLRENTKNLISNPAIKTWITPRRMAILVDNIDTSAVAESITVKGPKVDADPNSIKGFFRKHGLIIESIDEVKNTILDGNYYFEKKQSDDFTTRLKFALEKTLVDLSKTWEKSMIWEQNQPYRWVRPLRNILCILDEKIVDFEFLNVKSSNTTLGHRFMFEGDITINNPAEYESKMKEAKVILSFQDRKKVIKEQANKLAKDNNLTLNDDDLLISEIAGLVEYPHVLLGKIDTKFMKLPPELLIMVMKKHQRYLALLDSKGKFLAPYFIFVANLKTDDDTLIIKGNERVLTARFSDAETLYLEDRKNFNDKEMLNTMYEKLSGIPFFNTITMKDKADTTTAIGFAILDKMNYKVPYQINFSEVLKQAMSKEHINEFKTTINKALKTDLATETVKEFPELQGIIGQSFLTNPLLFRDLFIKNLIGKIIKEQYKPAGLKDDLPTIPESSVFAIADKLVDIYIFIGSGITISGGNDPYAIRRKVIGILRILENPEFEFEFSINNLIEILKENTSIQSNINSVLAIQDTEKKLDYIKSIFTDRFKFMLKDRFKHDVIDAVGIDLNKSVIETIQRMEALTKFLDTEEGKKFRAVMKRVHNIHNASNYKKDENYKITELSNYDIGLKNNIDFYYTIPETPDNLIAQATILTTFLDKVKVNDENPQLKAYRHQLLGKVIEISERLADFSKLEG